METTSKTIDPASFQTVDQTYHLQFSLSECLTLSGTLKTHGEQLGVKMDISDWLEETLAESAQ
jgi:hypothetical protein